MSGNVEVAAQSDVPAAGPPRWLVVVRRDQPALYAYLRRGFEGIGLVEVILDRREGGRSPGAIENDHPDAERRRPATPKERSRWRSFGYRVVALADGESSDTPPP